MEEISPLAEVFVCQTCGDEGFTNAFVYCVKCLNFVIHRYCLNVMPKTLDELVIWYCERCKSTVQNQDTLPDVQCLNKKTEFASLGNVATHHKKKQKKESDIASLIAKTKEVVCDHISEKNHTNTENSAQPRINPARRYEIHSPYVCNAGKSRCEGVSQLRVQLDGKGYPVRPGKPDCIFYQRTGMCDFGNRCKFNHPTHVEQANQHRGELLERVEKTNCVCFVKTGSCKYGSSCKYYHPPPCVLNVLGLPMRQGEKACTHYIRTGSCIFGMACKFHHPQPHK